MIARRIAAAVALAAGLAATSPGALDAPARAGEHRPPNVLIIVTDDQRLDGTMVALPAVARWFGRDGTEFPNSFATTPLCCPSRASILTGLYPHNHSVTFNGPEARRDLDFSRTLPAYFKSAGYRTGLFGKFFNSWPGDVDPPYFDRWAQGGSGYFNSRFNIQGRIRWLSRYSTHVISNRASRFMNRSIDIGKPWFLYVAPVAAHAPFTPEPAYERAPVPKRPRDASVGEQDRSDKPPWVAQRPPTVPYSRIGEIYRGQLRTLMSVDDMVHRLFSELTARGEADNTIAIFTSDNGFLWGEHGLARKKYPYLPAIQVPLFLRWPGHVAAGTKDMRIAANIDIAPTVLAAAGIDPPETLDGMSLLDPIRRHSLFLEYVSASNAELKLPTWDAVLNGNHQYVVYEDPEGNDGYREYYDLVEDPAQLTNLLGDDDPGNDPPAPLLEVLEAQIDRGRECSGTSCWMVP